MKRRKLLLSLVFIFLCCGSIYADQHYEGWSVCEIPPLDPPVVQRIQSRDYPSIGLPGSSFVAENPLRWFPWDPHQSAVDARAKHDMRYFFSLHWKLTPTEPTLGLSTRTTTNLEWEKYERQQFLQRNPNFIVLPGIAFHTHGSLDAFPPDSDFWLKNRDGGALETEVEWDEFIIDILNPEVQQLHIDRIVGLAECGLYDGVLIDNLFNHGVTVYYQQFATDEEIIDAHETILKGVRERVRNDFLILVNGSTDRLRRYKEYINGSHMELARESPAGYTYERLKWIEGTILWNEKNLREPRINVVEGHGVLEPFESPTNLRWMRLFTTISLTHSDGYSIFRVPTREIDGYLNHTHTWYRFWDAPLGRPVGEIGQLYEHRDGVFIREFSNGWAVYNRSGKPQEIRIPASTGWSSGITGVQHTLGDLDGEIYLKLPVWDVNADGQTNILDLVLVANAMNTDAPDLNGDGVVNILDLVLVANHIGE